MTALITAGASVETVVPAARRDDLTAWFNLYMSIEVEPGSNTYRAKLGDLKWFLRFFFESTSGYECDQWTRSLSKSFLSWIQKTEVRAYRKTARTEHLPQDSGYGKASGPLDSPPAALPGGLSVPGCQRPEGRRTRLEGADRPGGPAP